MDAAPWVEDIFIANPQDAMSALNPADRIYLSYNQKPDFIVAG